MGFVIALLLGMFMGGVIVAGLWATFKEPGYEPEPEPVSAFERAKRYEAVFHVPDLQNVKTLLTPEEVEILRKDRAAQQIAAMERGRRLQAIEERATDA